ncbi:MAG: methyl-accepting chemotaxis protein [Solirubrobacterales bacterium]
MLLIDSKQSEVERSAADGIKKDVRAGANSFGKPKFALRLMLAGAAPLLLFGFISAISLRGGNADAASRVQWCFGLATLWICAISLTNARRASSGAAAQLSSMIDFTRAAAAGDFGRDLRDSGDPRSAGLEQALRRMVGSFDATVAEIERSAAQLTSAAGEMADTSDQAGQAIGEIAHSIGSISQGASQQVEVVVETSGAVAEIEAAIQNAADTADEALRQTAETENLTDEGVSRATEVQEAMLAVHDASVASAETLRSLGEKSGDIDEIVQAITDIAAQTNLLALNAAIEAARAGEQGRGFAVVAEEVRRLAEDAHSSAGHIAELIGEIQVQTRDAVSAMDDGLARVENGFDAVNRNRQAFFEISGAVRTFRESSGRIAEIAGKVAGDAALVREQIEEVASVAQQSSASTEQVSASTEQTSAASQQVTASAQQVAQTAASLAELAKRRTVRVGAAG